MLASLVPEIGGTRCEWNRRISSRVTCTRRAALAHTALDCAISRAPASSNIVSDVVPKSSCCMAAACGAGYSSAGVADIRGTPCLVFMRLPISSAPGLVFFSRRAHPLSAPAQGRGVRKRDSGELRFVFERGLLADAAVAAAYSASGGRATAQIPERGSVSLLLPATSQVT